MTEDLKKQLEQAQSLIKQKDIQIKELNSNLEQKVKERTIELESLNKQLMLAYDQAKDADRVKSEFLDNMSHELRNPLNAIIGYLSISLQDLKSQISQEQFENLSQSEKAAKSLLQLINDILDFSRMGSGKKKLHIEKFNLSDLLQNAFDDACELLTNKDVEMKKDFPEKLVIESDRAKLELIFDNLLNNAIKFTQKGEILLQVNQDNDWIVANVSDTGCGIPQDKIETIFNLFQQLDSSTKKNFGGTGLGLTITKKLCDMLGIIINVTSLEGLMTIFQLNIPVESKRK